MTSIRIKLLSKKAILLLFGLFIMAVFAGISLYWIAFWFLLLWLTVSMAWLLFTARGLDLNLQVHPAVTVRNSRIIFKVSLNSCSILPFPPGELYLTYPLNWYHNRVEEKVEIDGVSSARGWERTLQFDCFNRGYHHVGPLKIRLYEPLSGIVVEKHFPRTKSFVVNPRLLSFRGTFPGKNGLPLETRRKNFIALPDAVESYDLRPFIFGDPPKRINWKVSAKHGDLYTRRVENTGDNRFLVCIELSRDLFTSSLEQDLLLEEALSLTSYLLAKGFHVGVFTSDGEKRYLPPEKGKKQLFLARKLFAELRPEAAGNLAEDLLHSNWKEKNISLLWIVPELSKSYIASLSKLRARWQLHTLFITADNIDRDANSFLSAHFPLQLKYRNNKVGIGEVKIS